MTSKIPSGFRPLLGRVLIQPDALPETIGGSSILAPDSYRDRKGAAIDRGRVVAVGDGCYTFDQHGDSWTGLKPAVGDHVLFPRYGGRELELDDGEYRLMEDKEIYAVID